MKDSLWEWYKKQPPHIQEYYSWIKDPGEKLSLTQQLIDWLKGCIWLRRKK